MMKEWLLHLPLGQSVDNLIFRLDIWMYNEKYVRVFTQGFAYCHPLGGGKRGFASLAVGLTG
jgi:hypothetical protein